MFDVKIYVDGGSKSNGSEDQSGYGSFAVEYNGEIKRRSTFELGNITNNEAEYQALLKAIKYADKVIATNPKSVIRWSFLLDSKLVLNQVNGDWKVKAPHLLPLVAEAREWVEKNDVTLVSITGTQMKKVLGH